MKVPDELFQLIRSLERSEKRYFKLYASMHIKDADTNNYVKLFDELDKQDEYNEEKILKKFRNETFIKQLHVTKKYLYNAILKSLRLYNAEKDKPSELREMLKDVETLYGKSLYRQCRKVLDKAKKTAMDYELYPQLIDIYNWYKILYRSEAYSSESEEDIEKLYKEFEEALSQMHNINDYWLLSVKAFFLRKKKGNIRGKSELDEFNKLINHPLLASDDKATNYYSRIFLYNLKGLYFLNNKDTEQFYIYCRKLSDYIESNSVMINEDNYIVSLNNLLLAQTELNKYDEAFKTIEKLKTIAPRSKTVRRRLFVTIYDTELNLYLKLGEFRKGAGLVEDIRKGLDEFRGKINSEAEMLFNYNVAYLFFGMGNYPSALDWLNKLLNSDVKVRDDLQSFARIFNLIIHYELKHFDFIEYTIRSTQRFLDKKHKLYEFESTILSFIKKLINASGSTEKEIFRMMKDKLDMLTKDMRENKAFEYFDFISWIESRISGRTFGDIIKEKSAA